MQHSIPVRAGIAALLLGTAGPWGLQAGGTSSVVWYVDDDCSSPPGSGSWLSPFCTIQAGIDSASNGDEVRVRAGVYAENIDFRGKAITLRSEAGPEFTLIDGGGVGPVVSFQSGETGASVLQGFSIVNGDNPNGSGGGVRCVDASPTLLGNWIRGNSSGTEGYVEGAGGGVYLLNSWALVLGNLIEGNSVSGFAFGGGVYCSGGSPTIRENTIRGNSAAGVIVGSRGGGVFLGSPALLEANVIVENHARMSGGGVYSEASAQIQHNLIARNLSDADGGGLYVHGGAPSLVGNTIVENEATAGQPYGRGGGILCSYHAQVSVKDSILWGNLGSGQGDEICVLSPDHPSTLSISFSDLDSSPGSVYVYSGCTMNRGFGMIAALPLFLDSSAGDYRLRQNPPDPGVPSPCVDAGDPLASVPSGTTRSDWNQDAAPVDMGFHTPIPRALASRRNDGPNPESYLASPPVVGSTWTAEVDLAITGHSLAQIAAFSLPMNVRLAGGQVLLGGGSRVFTLPARPGPLATWSVPVPTTLSMVGHRTATQAIHIGGVVPFALSNARDLVVGF